MIAPHCAPPLQHRGQLWHWLRTPRDGLTVACWDDGSWWLNCDLDEYSPVELGKFGYVYVTHAPPPSFLKGSRFRVVKIKSGDAGLLGRLGTVVARDDEWCRVRLDRESAVRLFPVDCLEELSQEEMR